MHLSTGEILTTVAPSKLWLDSLPFLFPLFFLLLQLLFFLQDHFFLWQMIVAIHKHISSSIKGTKSILSCFLPSFIYPPRSSYTTLKTFFFVSLLLSLSFLSLSQDHLRPSLKILLRVFLWYHVFVYVCLSVLLWWGKQMITVMVTFLFYCLAQRLDHVCNNKNVSDLSLHVHMLPCVTEDRPI